MEFKNRKTRRPFSPNNVAANRVNSSTPRVPAPSNTPKSHPDPRITRQHAQAIKKPAQPAHKSVNISINLAVPASTIAKIKAAKNRIKSLKVPKIPRLPSPREIVQYRHFKAVAAALGVFVILFVCWEIFINKPPARPTDPGQVQGAESTTPDFEPSVPGDKKDIKRLYDPQRKVISFNDTLAGTPITVSQQKLPEAFKIDPQGSVENMAKKFNATTPIEAGDVKAFAGKSANGPQSVVFHKDGLLVFIYAAKEIDKENLATYIKILE